LYSISLFSLTATLRLIARCNVDKGRFGCCCDDGEEDNLADHFTVEKIVARIKRFLWMQIHKQVKQPNSQLYTNDSEYLDGFKGDR
jgi:hypothetical protein